MGGDLVYGVGPDDEWPEECLRCMEDYYGDTTTRRCPPIDCPDYAPWVERGELASGDVSPYWLLRLRPLGTKLGSCD